ncbi:hypothetical protein HBE96_17420 [Clostridium sp. P21]|uniref:Nucleoside diphosphate kinase-like domain-containing protein n=1 Tax=Clostridium muellerianum TaxID=2716538 RepID=A0A7Y0EJ87_9CLOT|nr:nucleoside-diphosphate kinase [Clostridium muellerianum]NMM64402.1 hypothetical protein [Clostridium muellerianum]
MVKRVNKATSFLEAASGNIYDKFANNKERNLAHSSDSLQSAARKLKTWFSEIF